MTRSVDGSSATRTSDTRQLVARLRYAWGVCWAAGPALAAGQLVPTVVGGLLPSVATVSTKVMIDGLVAHQPASVLYPLTFTQVTVPATGHDINLHPNSHVFLGAAAAWVAALDGKPAP